MNITDVYIAGLKGKQVQAGMGMANQFYFILNTVITAVTIGTIAVLSRIFGSEERESKLPSAVYTAVLFALSCAVVVTLVAVIGAPFIMERMNIDPAVKKHAVSFIKFYCAGLFFNLMMVHFNGIFRACGMMVLSMKIMVVASVLNIILSIALVFFSPLQENGIPAATAISWLAASLAATPAVLRLMKSKDGSKNIFSKETAKKIFSISWPSGVVSMSWQLASTLLFAFVGMLPENSVESMAALTAGLRIESMIYLPGFAFNMANAVLVGNLLGERKPDDAFRIGLVTASVGVCVIIMMTVIVIFLAEPIANIFASRDDAGSVDPVVVQEIVRYLRIVMISEPFMACNLILSGALGGAGDTRALMRYSIFSLWILRVPLAYVFAIKLGYGAAAIWWAMNITFFSQSFLSGRRYFSKKWIKQI